jgi:hypothetical protein
MVYIIYSIPPPPLTLTVTFYDAAWGWELG